MSYCHCKSTEAYEIKCMSPKHCGKEFKLQITFVFQPSNISIGFDNSSGYCLTRGFHCERFSRFCFDFHLPFTEWFEMKTNKIK